MKYTLLKNKVTGERSIRVNKTGVVVSEKVNPEQYLELRKKAVTNLKNAARNQMLSDLGLVKVRGNLGGTYWE